MEAINLPPIIESAYGTTLISSWLILIREDYEYVDAFLKKQASSDRRAFELNLTFEHEFVHFIQGLSTAFTHSYSVGVQELCSDLMAVSRAGQLTAEVLRNYKEAFAGYKEQFQSPFRGISTTDLLEAMAVTESFRSTVPQATSAAFREYLQVCFPDPESVYRRVLGVVWDRFGEDAALGLTPRLCFLALNGDTPAKNFWFFIDMMQELGAPAHISDIPAWDLALGFGMNPEQVYLCQYKSLPAEGKNKLLPDYVELLLSLGSPREVFEFAARPGDWFRSTTDERLGLLAPPVLLCSGGRGHIQGLARNWSRNRIFQLLDAAALIGIGERLLTDGKPYQVCPHTDCPIHDTALCHTWYAVPQKTSWSQCAFPKRLEVQFKMTAKALMEMRVKAGGKD